MTAYYKNTLDRFRGKLMNRNLNSSYVNERINSISKWHHTIEVAPGIFTPGSYDPRGVLKYMKLPNDLSGKRVLDIGTRDGYYAFEAEKRGAEVIAVDYCPSNQMGFDVAKDLLNSSAQFYQENIYNLPDLDLGLFDIVFCLGLVYHVPDPYLAFEIVRGLTKNGGTTYIESNCLDAGILTTQREEIDIPKEFSSYPLAMFTRLNITNYWCMNRACLEKIANDVGYKVERVETWGKRIMLILTAEENKQADKAMTLARGLSENAL